MDPDKTKIVLGESLAIAPGKEEFTGNAKANAFLTRDYRKPFVVPAESEI